MILPLLKQHRLTFYFLAIVLAAILILAFQARTRASTGGESASSEMVD